MTRISAYPATKVIAEYYKSSDHKYGFKPGTNKRMERIRKEVYVPLPLLAETVEHIAKMAITALITNDLDKIYEATDYKKWGATIVLMEEVPNIQIAIERKEDE